MTPLEVSFDALWWEFCFMSPQIQYVKTAPYIESESEQQQPFYITLFSFQRIGKYINDDCILMNEALVTQKYHKNVRKSVYRNTNEYNYN